MGGWAGGDRYPALATPAAQASTASRHAFPRWTMGRSCGNAASSLEPADMILAHLPAGYLLCRLAYRRFRHRIPSDRRFMLWGLRGSIAPDLDMLYFRLIDHQQTHHHEYVTHWPILWGSLLMLWVMAGAPATAAIDPWFDQAYQNGEAYRLTAWGKRYEAGVGVDQSSPKAIRLYCKAAMLGDAEAKYRLGQVYAFGRGIRNDPELAAAWFYNAAQSDHAKARRVLEVLKIEKRPKRRPSCMDAHGERVSPTWAKGAGARGPVRAPAEIERLVRALAPHYGLDPGLVLALVEAESSFDPKARSHKNAQGLMQLIPATAQRFGVRDVWDPEQNLRGGMAYLRWLLDYFDGDLELALAGYNAGEAAVERYGGIPPYKETRAYVARIVGRLQSAP